MRKLMSALAMLAGLTAVSATATNSLLFDFDNGFNGSTPSGPAPWMTATITNLAPGSVLLTLRTDGLVSGEKIGEVDFNLDPTLAAGVKNLRFVYQAGSSGVKPPSIQAGNDAFKVATGGYFDIKLSFDVSNKHSFGAGEFVSIKISGPCGLTADDFETLSAPSHGSGRYYSAADVQGIPAGERHETASGWVNPTAEAVPEPGPAALLMCSGLFWLLVRRPGRG